MHLEAAPCQRDPILPRLKKIAARRACAGDSRAKMTHTFIVFCGMWGRVEGCRAKEAKRRRGTQVAAGVSDACACTRLSSHLPLACLTGVSERVSHVPGSLLVLLLTPFIRIQIRPQVFSQGVPRDAGNVLNTLQTAFQNGTLEKLRCENKGAPSRRPVFPRPRTPAPQVRNVGT